MQPTQTDSLSGLLGSLAIFMVIGLVCYVYFSITLMIIARKSHTPNAGLAWIPILNLFLMCQIARRSGGYVLLMLIPLVNIFALVIIWMSIAQVRGKPSWMGALILLPVIGLIVPAYLASGPAINPDVPATPPHCPHCRAALDPGETFCGECGNAVPLMAATTARTSGSGTALIGLGVGAAMLLLLAGVVWFFVFREIPYTPPNRQKPQLPQRAEGTIREFPVDTSTTAPATPSSVVTQDFTQATAAQTVKTPSQWLPAGVDRSSLPRRAKGMTSATYRTKPKSTPTAKTSPPPSTNTNTGVVTASAEDSIYVHVLEAPPSYGGEIADNVNGAMRGERTGVEVTSNDGDVYTGSRIRVPNTEVYVLSKQGAEIVIIIYAPSAATQEVADRLVRNVGNGQGLNDYPEVKESLWTLPMRPPADLVLQEVNTFTSADFDRSMREIESATDKNSDEAQKALSQIRAILPERMITARYLDSAKKEWNVIECDYASTRSALNTWRLLSWTIGLTSMKSIAVGTNDGLYVEQDGERVLIFQKGPYLMILSSPSASPIDRLIALGNGFQI